MRHTHVPASDSRSQQWRPICSPTSNQVVACPALSCSVLPCLQAARKAQLEASALQMGDTLERHSRAAMETANILSATAVKLAPELKTEFNKLAADACVITAGLAEMRGG